MEKGGRWRKQASRGSEKLVGQKKNKDEVEKAERSLWWNGGGAYSAMAVAEGTMVGGTEEFSQEA